MVKNSTKSIKKFKAERIANFRNIPALRCKGDKPPPPCPAPWRFCASMKKAIHMFWNRMHNCLSRQRFGLKIFTGPKSYFVNISPIKLISHNVGTLISNLELVFWVWLLVAMVTMETKENSSIGIQSCVHTHQHKPTEKNDSLTCAQLFLSSDQVCLALLKI